MADLQRHAAVRNAADHRQRNRAVRKERQRAGDYRAWLKRVLALPAGRAVLAHLVFDEGLLYQAVFSSDAMELAHRIGRQQFAQEVRDDCLEADADAWQLLEREYYARIADDNFATDASHAAIEREDREDPAFAYARAIAEDLGTKG